MPKNIAIISPVTDSLSTMKNPHNPGVDSIPLSFYLWWL